MSPELRAEVMAVARAEIGAREQPRGSNWGEDVARYLASVGIESPAAWCAAFVYWCFERVMPVQNELPRSGYTPLIHAWAKREKRIIKPRKAQPADLVLFHFPSLKRVAHVGLVGKVDVAGGFVWTIEGNTNDEGSREGYEVARRRRRLSDRMIFVNMELR